ncbi:MAG: imidazole glycerol phosphate synthase subunit HisH, partial [Patescibacteria group bacterium]
MIGIIDYGSGNLKSVTNALEKIGQKFVLVNQPDKLNGVDKVILPGVGAAGYAMSELDQRGFTEVLRNLKISFLGICLGMQLLAQYSEEGEVKCLGLISGKVQKFEDTALKVPQVGWNKVCIVNKMPLFDGIDDEQYFYFVNSYYLSAKDSYVTSEAYYGVEFAASIRSGNFYGVQFHP